MKAVVISAPGAPEVLQVQERPTPTPAPHQVLVKVHAAGINRPDVAQRKGHYPPPAGAPADIPGLEIAGIIEACGANVERWQTGEAVCALLPGGGYAEYVVVDARHCLPLPQGWSFEEAASLPETVFTVWHNVFQRGQLKAGENFLVHGGSSGIGITAIQLAKALGARVFATAGSAEKCRACEELGAERCINYKTEDFEEALQPEGLDVILDMVGGDYIPKNLNLLQPDGRLVFINAMQGAKGEFSVIQVMQKRLTLTGSTLRPRDANFKAALAAEIEQHVWPLLEAGKFKPVLSQTFPLEEAAQAHTLMESSTHIGKIVLLVD
ncbi:NAD(P)H-quinone oxidoreductase [Rufibacter quisquiliarum]|uniref:Putative PIG3 family NAD(P)H quinone oxidoreductase n=1 Tax=Rufibacter quisquiliarum TaxID=1549639 RepID=A0A839GK80_9BACT|nr:NAD(P)H-quinone oxidoreductase [Rufibacter quisquiliarum]MBA9078173.1 putative PIG3 family NAD(P)H quinone oxidoreductase [Rufibacter quisquiliarum]